MQQAIVKKGKVINETIPAPLTRNGGILIKVVNSCISAGTEMSNINVTKKSLIQLALDQPELVKQGLGMIQQYGIKKTMQRIKGQKEGGKPIGYSASGVVIGVGEGVSGFKIGDKVAAAGAGIANHAEFIDVPQNLVIKMPDGLDFKEASTVTLGGIAMQGVRRADLRFGETAVVVGAGILGLLSVQMLKVSGVRVIAVDIDNKRLSIAKELGAELIINPADEDQVKLITNHTNGYGADAVLFTAATASSEPLSNAFKSCKRKGKVVLVGVSGMEIKRGDIYAKELDFLISTSYGPGRYDNNYEEKGLDYPYSYVRWTENRNMTEYLRLLGSGEIRLDRIIQKTFPIENVEEAYNKYHDKENKPLMVILEYGEPSQDLAALLHHPRKVIVNNKKVDHDKINVALIGAGSFATGMHLPNLNDLSDKYNLYAVVNRTGHKAIALGAQFGANVVTSNVEDILNDENVDLALISTRHDSHAELALKFLKAGKHVFVEKPLSTTQKDLDKIKEFYSNGTNDKPVLMPGFNRRFSKYAKEIKRHTDKRINPLFVQYRMNAGYIPLDHWVHEDGGRIVGEACHIIDLMTYFTGAEIESISYEKLNPQTGYFSSSDNVAIVLKYIDGSVCNIHYFANGSKQMPKEQMEVHFDEKSILMTDYKKLEGFGIKLENITSTASQKGQKEELIALHKCLKEDRVWPIEFWDMVQTTEISFAIV